MIAFCADVKEDHPRLFALGLVLEEHGAIKVSGNRRAGVEMRIPTRRCDILDMSSSGGPTGD